MPMVNDLNNNNKNRKLRSIHKNYYNTGSMNNIKKAENMIYVNDINSTDRSIDQEF